jgi:GntR family transcriptional regulator
VIVRVDPSSPVPPFEQIRMQIETMTTSGVLLVGARLPTIRQLAKDLGVAGGTVARAYRELEADGVIVTRGRHGSYVAEANGNAQRNVPNEALVNAAQAFAIRARQLGVDSTRALKLAQEALESTGLASPPTPKN